MMGTKYGILFFLISVFATARSQQVLNVTSLLARPYLSRAVTGNDSQTNATGYNGDGYEGYMKDLLDGVFRRVKMDYQLHIVPDGYYGSMHPQTGKWDGMIGELVDGTADMAAGPLTVSAARARVVTFTQPFQSVGPVIVLKKPATTSPPLSESLTRLLVPLQFSVWLMIVLAFLVTGTVLYIVAHFNPYEWRRMHKDGEATFRESESFTCLNSFWFVLSTLAWQGYVRTPRSMGGRITVLAWWVFVLITIVTYTASLVNLLRVAPTVAEVEGYSSIRSFKDLADNEDIKVGVIKNGATMQHFMNSQYSTDQIIFKKIADNRNESLMENHNSGIQKLRAQKYAEFAMVIESTIAKYYVGSQQCDLFMISENLVTKHYSLALKINSIHVETINLALLELQESGELNRLEKKWFSGKCAQSNIFKANEVYEIPYFYALDLGTFSGALLILSVGLVFGGFITIIEYCIFKWAESHADEDVTKPAEETPLQAGNAGPDDSMLRSGVTRKGGATQV